MDVFCAVLKIYFVDSSVSATALRISLIESVNWKNSSNTSFKWCWYSMWQVLLCGCNLWSSET